jgi:erythromycin esterase
MTAPSAGTHLAAEFGDDYFALALTGGSGVTTGLTTDEGAPLGFRVHPEELGPPEPDSVEAALGDAGACLIDLRADKNGLRPQRIRHAHMFSPVDVAEAFDALVYLPRIDVCAHVTRSSDLSCPG